MESPNPYGSPQAVVANIVAPIAGPPLAPRVAVYLISTCFALGVIQVIRDPGMTSPLPQIVASIVVSLIAWGLFDSVRKARNWVRWLFIGWALLNLVTLLLWFDYIPDQIYRLILLGQTALFSAGAFLFMLPSSRHWFAKRPDA